MARARGIGLGWAGLGWAGLGWMVFGLVACARPQGQPADPEPSPAAESGALESAPPKVWAERETYDGPQPTAGPERFEYGRLDPSDYQDMTLGVAHGPDRQAEAENVAEAIRRSGLPLEDVWSVDASSWDSDNPGGRCTDRVAYFNEGAREFAFQLRDALDQPLTVEPDVTEASYDVIVQLCPRELSRGVW